MMNDGDEITRMFNYNETKTAVTLIISSKKPMNIDEYKAILYDFIQELDVDDIDLFQDDQYIESFN